MGSVSLRTWWTASSLNTLLSCLLCGLMFSGIAASTCKASTPDCGQARPSGCAMFFLGFSVGGVTVGLIFVPTANVELMLSVAESRASR